MSRADRPEGEIYEQAKKCLGSPRSEIVDALADLGVTNLGWYLREKIVGADENQRKDHLRVLKYARLFARSGKVTLVHESQAPTPDMRVDVSQTRFYIEVKKFRQPGGEGQVNTDSKIVGAIKGKLRQLVPNEVNFVAIDNFDLRLEFEPADGGLTHEKIEAAFSILKSACAEHPADYGKLSGVIFAAQSTGGVLTGPLTRTQIWESIPHFVWVNPIAHRPVPKALETWIFSALQAAHHERRHVRRKPIPPTSSKWPSH